MAPTIGSLAYLHQQSIPASIIRSSVIACGWAGLSHRQTLGSASVDVLLWFLNFQTALVVYIMHIGVLLEYTMCNYFASTLDVIMHPVVVAR